MGEDEFFVNCKTSKHLNICVCIKCGLLLVYKAVQCTNRTMWIMMSVIIIYLAKSPKQLQLLRCWFYNRERNLQYLCDMFQAEIWSSYLLTARTLWNESATQKVKHLPLSAAVACLLRERADNIPTFIVHVETSPMNALYCI